MSTCVGRGAHAVDDQRVRAGFDSRIESVLVGQLFVIRYPAPLQLGK